MSLHVTDLRTLPTYRPPLGGRFDRHDLEDFVENYVTIVRPMRGAYTIKFGIGLGGGKFTYHAKAGESAEEIKLNFVAQIERERIARSDICPLGQTSKELKRWLRENRSLWGRI